MQDVISRRLVLKKTVKAALGLGAYSALNTFLFSCEKKNYQEPEIQAKLLESTPCSTLESLSADQIAIRKNLKYVDQTPISTRTCDNCKLYTNPIKDSYCGGCKIITGPIHPKGYCSSWYARM